MDKLKNSFALGILLGLAISVILLVCMDAIFYLIQKINGQKLLQTDAIFVICILGSLILSRKLLKTEGKQEVGKGFLFSAFIWGAAYVFLFHISPIKSLFFAV